MVEVKGKGIWHVLQLLIRKMCDTKTLIKWHFTFPSTVNNSLEHQAIHNVLTIQIQKSVKQTQWHNSKLKQQYRKEMS